MKFAAIFIWRFWEFVFRSDQKNNSGVIMFLIAQLAGLTVLLWKPLLHWRRFALWTTMSTLLLLILMFQAVSGSLWQLRHQWCEHIGITGRTWSMYFPGYQITKSPSAASTRNSKIWIFLAPPQITPGLFAFMPLQFLSFSLAELLNMCTLFLFWASWAA